METDFSKQHIMAADADVFLLPVGQLLFYRLDACLSPGRKGVFREFDERDYFCSFFGWRQWFPGRRSRGRLVSKTQRIKKRKKTYGDAWTGSLLFFIRNGCNF